MTSNESQQLNPWFKLFFNLNESKISIDELQQWLFDAGFDEPFSEENKKEIQARIHQPEKNITYSYEIGVIEALFGKRVRNINVNEPNENEICDFTAYLFNSINPPLSVTEQNEIWKDDVLKRTIATPIAKSLLGYEISIPEEKVVLTYFNYNYQTYGFFHSDDLNISMFIVMRNIDCFLSFIGRPERVFRFKQSVEDIDHFILAEPKKFRALANKLQIPILDTLDETEFQSEVADYDIPPSLCTVEFQENKVKIEQNQPKVNYETTPTIGASKIQTKSLNKNINANKLIAEDSHHPWYYRLLLGAIILASGYGVAYWKYGASVHSLEDKLKQSSLDNQRLQTKIIQLLNQVQVEQYNQAHLNRELHLKQEEVIKLREDLSSR